MAVAYSASSTLTGPVLLGLLIDWLAGTMPWFTVGGVLVGHGRTVCPAAPLRAAEGAAAVRGFAVLVGVARRWRGSLLAGPAALLGGDGPEVTVPALLVCLAPNLLALGVAELVQDSK